MLARTESVLSCIHVWWRHSNGHANNARHHRIIFYTHGWFRFRYNNRYWLISPPTHEISQSEITTETSQFIPNITASCRQWQSFNSISASKLGNFYLISCFFCSWLFKINQLSWKSEIYFTSVFTFNYRHCTSFANHGNSLIRECFEIRNKATKYSSSNNQMCNSWT